MHLERMKMLKMVYMDRGQGRTHGHLWNACWGMAYKAGHKRMLRAIA